MRLLSSEQLAQSPVVANCRMNRERQAYGDNSYEREPVLNPVSFLNGGIRDTQVYHARLRLCVT